MIFMNEIFWIVVLINLFWQLQLKKISRQKKNIPRISNDRSLSSIPVINELGDIQDSGQVRVWGPQLSQGQYLTISRHVCPTNVELGVNCFVIPKCLALTVQGAGVETRNGIYPSSAEWVMETVTSGHPCPLYSIQGEGHNCKTWYTYICLFVV